MLTIKNFDVLKGRTFVMPNLYTYDVIEAGEDVSSVRREAMYSVKLKSNQNQKDVRFALYRDMSIKEGGYRLYNSVDADYIIVTKKGLIDMRTFTDILKDELKGLC